MLTDNEVAERVEEELRADPQIDGDGDRQSESAI
jgi:hypothetical protein